jgi:hypothetical protein
MTDHGDFSRRLAEDGRDPESAELTRTFNLLIERVDRVLVANALGERFSTTATRGLGNPA